jgi:hypothetical protein
MALALLGLSIPCSGCALVEDSCRNLCQAVCRPFETHMEVSRNRLWAENAWGHACSSNGQMGFSEDYAQGFKDGYAEYLYRGGDCEPPLLPPKHYRRVQYQTPEGYQAVENWFAGYRHGAMTARDTGARRWITGPTGLVTPQVPHGTVQLPGRPNEQPITLPMPQILPTPNPEQQLPGGVTIEVEPPSPIPNVGPQTGAVPPPEAPLRAKILGMSVPLTEMMEAPQPKASITGINVPEQEPRAMIRGIVLPRELEEPAEPMRVRIRTVTPATKE